MLLIAFEDSCPALVSQGSFVIIIAFQGMFKCLCPRFLILRPLDTEGEGEGKGD